MSRNGLNINSNGLQCIRCTVYCDIGYTKSGEWTRDGIAAGKEEWLGKAFNLYRVGADGMPGELIGRYEFKDTGYGIDGSLLSGTSIDIWRPSLDACRSWVAEYGDYAYVEILND